MSRTSRAGGSAALPAGTVTFLFTDIEGSTQLLHRLGDDYVVMLDDHRRLLREAFREHNGHEVGTEGDSFFVAFEQPDDAIAAAVAGQLALAHHDWQHGSPIRVRMGIHTGEARVRENDYVGFAVHEAARVSASAHGGQILITDRTNSLVTHANGVSARSLGSHRLKDIPEAVELLQVTHPDLDDDFPPLRTLDARPNNLPVQLTSFVGREREMDDVRRAIQTNRLVTVTGAGGAGKTRLSIEVASELLDEFPDGIWFVDLAPVGDGGLVANEVAQTIGIRQTDMSRGMTDVVCERLDGKRVLVLFDNCEHLLDGCATLAQAILSRSATPRIIATSREPLGVQGEATWRIPSLDLPPEGTDDLDAAMLLPSVRLFLDRARLARHDFEPHPDDASALVRICRRLDGIPLAIELAAARVKSLSCAAIADRLDDRFGLLVSGSRTALPRQRTLEALVAWSYDLLSDDERRLLRRLSIFATTMSLEGVEHICAGDGLASNHVLDLIESLVDKSLVQIEGSDVRYRLLETIRQYARTKLVEAGEAEGLRPRFVEYYVDLVHRRWRSSLMGPLWRETIALFEAEHDNIRAAFDTSLTIDTDAALALASHLGWFWWSRGYMTEGRERVRAALAAHDGTATSARAAALSVRAFLEQMFSQVDTMEELAAEAIAIFAGQPTAADDAWAWSWAHATMATARGVKGDLLEASRHAERAWEIARQSGERWAEGRAIQELSSIASSQGDHEEARRLAVEGLAIARDIDMRSGVIRLLSSLGQACYRLGDFDSASEAWLEGLETSREAGDLIGVSLCFRGLGSISRQLGDVSAAAGWAREHVRFTRGWGEKPYLVDVLNTLAYAELALGDLDAAHAAAVEALDTQRAAGLPTHEFLHTLGEMYQARGELDDAERLFDETIAEASRHDKPLFVAIPRVNLGEIARSRGRLDEAVACHRTALAESDHPFVRGRVLRCLALVAADRGDVTAAAQLFGSAEVFGFANMDDPILQARYDVLNAQIDDAVRRAASQMSPDEALALVDALGKNRPSPA